jgi:hypothetical protein
VCVCVCVCVCWRERDKLIRIHMLFIHIKIYAYTHSFIHTSILSFFSLRRTYIHTHTHTHTIISLTHTQIPRNRRIEVHGCVRARELVDAAPILIEEGVRKFLQELERQGFRIASLCECEVAYIAFNDVVEELGPVRVRVCVWVGGRERRCVCLVKHIHISE